MSNQQIYLALYRGHRSGSGLKVWLARATDWLTRILTRGQYSHAEIVVREHPQASVYTCYSASIRDKGVRCKVMPLPATKWDLIPLPSTPEAHEQLQRVWTATEGQGYDLMGALGIAFGLPQNRRRWFCSEWCAAAWGVPDGWRGAPNDLAASVPALKREA